MKKSIICGVIAAAIAMTGLSSCLGNDTPASPQTFTATLNPDLNFSGVKDLATGNWNSYPGGTLRYMYDLDAGTLQFGVSGAVIAQGVSLTFTLPAIPMTFGEDGSWVGNHPGPFTVAGGGQTHKVTDLKTYVRLPVNAASIVATEFTIDSRYLVRIFPVFNYFGGVTSVSLNDGDSFQTQTTYYNLNLDQKTMTAELFAFRSKFAQSMPAMDLVYPNLLITLTDTGLSFGNSEVTPFSVSYNNQGVEEGRTEFPAFKLTDFKGEMQIATSLSFSCDRADGRGTTTFTGTPLIDVKTAD